MRIQRNKDSFKELEDFRAITDFKNPVEVFTEHGKVKMNNLHTKTQQSAQDLIDDVVWGKSKPISRLNQSGSVLQ